MTTLNDISCFSLPKMAEEKYYNIEGQRYSVNNLKQINIIIGPNNIGKSRLLRLLFQEETINYNLKNNIPAILAVLKYYLTHKFSNRNEKESINNLISHISNSESGFFDTNIKDEIDKTINQNLISKLFQENRTYEDLKLIKKLHNIRKEYIPTLRGLRTLDENKDLYLNRTLNDYFKKTKNKANIFTGHTLYNDLQYQLLGKKENRESVYKFQEYLSNHFFEGKNVELCPYLTRPSDNNNEEKNNVIHVKIGSEEERPIFELGDGIQAMIILSIKPFVETEPTIFFIEEPEHNLHPGMQRALIDALRSQSQHMYFLTTQSNHFVDLALESDDVNLITLEKIIDEDNEIKTQVSTCSEFGELIDSLGARASSVLLANCSIWVEGITDKLYLRSFLKKYIDTLESSERKNKLQSMQENLHYIFTEYQGSNITHWDFSDENCVEDTPAKRMNRNILLISDNDIVNKNNRVQELTNSLGINFYLLPYKEIENHIPLNVILEAAKIKWENTKKKQGCNIDRFDNITEEKFKVTDSGIGPILERYINKPKGCKRCFYKQGKTISDKVNFCRIAVNLMESKDFKWELTPELKELCEKICDHILEHNQ